MGEKGHIFQAEAFPIIYADNFTFTEVEHKSSLFLLPYSLSVSAVHNEFLLKSKLWKGVRGLSNGEI